MKLYKNTYKKTFQTQYAIPRNKWERALEKIKLKA